VVPTDEQQEGKVTPREVSGQEDAGQRQHYRGGEGRTEGNREVVRDLPQRVFGAAGTAGVAGVTVFGGIIAQLIRQAEERLGNAEECIRYHEAERERAIREAQLNIEWYERERERAEQTLEDLRAVLTQVQSQPNQPEEEQAGE
jgi:hypothetical protein